MKFSFRGSVLTAALAAVGLAACSGGGTPPAQYDARTTQAVAHAQALVPVNATYSYSDGTFTITNTSGSTIDIADMEFTFSYSAAISSFWGEPWMAWSGTSSAGTYTLTGGNTKGWPNGSVLTVSFTPSSSAPAPTNPQLFIVGARFARRWSSSIRPSWTSPPTSTTPSICFSARSSAGEQTSIAP
ncbi:MAG TPA: hypothetical protein VME66_07940 [Candidatus Acidoferrales bacterium]|nr:hypothetical protein [Candidatus Acidoferrales bacterium]